MEVNEVGDVGAIQQKLLEIIAERLEWPLDDLQVGLDSPIGGEGIGLDSLMIVEFALDIEEEFGFEVDEEQMLDIGSMTLGQVAEFITKRSAETYA